jgi:hypothetical protein
MIKQITNNGSNVMIADLSVYEDFHLRGFMRSKGHNLCNGTIFVKLTIFIKDMAGNVLESIYIEDDKRDVKSYKQLSPCNANSSIFKNIREYINLKEFENHGLIIIDVNATWQAEISGIKAGGKNYSQDIDLKMTLIEKETKQIAPKFTPKIITKDSGIVDSTIIPEIPIKLILISGVIGAVYFISKK